MVSFTWITNNENITINVTSIKCVTTLFGEAWDSKYRGFVIIGNYNDSGKDIPLSFTITPFNKYWNPREIIFDGTKYFIDKNDQKTAEILFNNIQNALALENLNE